MFAVCKGVLLFFGRHGSQGHGCCSPGFLRAWRATLFNSWLGALCLPVAKDIAYASHPGFRQGNCPPSNLQAGSINLNHKAETPGRNMHPLVFFLGDTLQADPSSVVKHGLPLLQELEHSRGHLQGHAKVQGRPNGNKAKPTKDSTTAIRWVPFFRDPPKICVCCFPF